MRNRESGSMAFTLSSVVAILGLTGMYLDRTHNLSLSAVKTARQQQTSILAGENAVSSAGFFKALISPSQTSNYIPAFLASNYYDQSWTLVKNEDLPSKNSELIDQKSLKVRLPVFDETPQDQIESIMNGLQSATSVSLRPSVVTLVRTNFDASGRHALTADIRIDSEVLEQGSKKPKSYNARVNLPAPVPRNPILELRNKGTVDWLDASKVSNIPPGTYQFRIKASGIAYDASVELDGVGEIKKVGGFKLVNGRAVISHGANNFAAKDEIIGDVWEYDLDPSVNQASPSTCKYVPVDGSYRFKLRVFGPDNTEAATAVTEVDVKVHDDNQAISDELRDYNYSNLCNDECPYVGPVDQFVGEIENLRISKQEFGDMTFYFRKTTAHWFGVYGMKKLCVNFEKPAALFSLVKGYPPPSFHALDGEGLAYTKYQEFFTYDLPSCHRKLLFARGACGCFAEKTLITMGDGVSQKPINEITYADKIWNPLTKKAYGIRKITKGPEKFAMIRIQAGDKEVTVTGKHPFPLREGFRAAHRLEKGDEIRLDDAWVKIDNLTVIAPGKNLPDAYNLELDADNSRAHEHNVLANGIVTGDLYIQTTLEQHKDTQLSSNDFLK